MRLAVVGSRSIQVDFTGLIPNGVTEIVSGGAGGVDTCAAEYARAHGLELTEIRPDYQRHGRAAPWIRNRQIVDAADEVLAVWDGRSRGTAYTIDYAKQRGKTVVVHYV